MTYSGAIRAINVEGVQWLVDTKELVVWRDRTKNEDATKMIDLYSALQDLFDEPFMMSCPVPMSAQTPVQFTMINGYEIRADSISYLRAGKAPEPCLRQNDATFKIAV